MPHHRGPTHPAIGVTVWPLLLAVAGLSTLVSSPALAERTRGGSAAGPAERVVLTYFADLSARRFTAAHLLEAPCSHRVAQPPGYAVFQARTRWASGSATIEARYVHSIQVTAMAPFHLPLLTAGHMQGFRLRGYFAFARPASPAGNPAEPMTLSRLVVFSWKCGGRWWVDPQWYFSSLQYGNR